MIKFFKIAIPSFVILCIAGLFVFKTIYKKEMRVDSLTFYMEDMFPFQYSVNGEMKGVCHEIVMELCRRLGFKPVIYIYEWEKAHAKALSDEGSCLFSAARIPSREEKFWWVGPIIDYDIAVYKLKKRSDIKIKLVDDLNKYKLLLKGDLFYDTIVLKQKGVKNFEKIEDSINDKSLFALNELFSESTDLIALSQLQAEAMCDYAGYNYSDLEIVYEHQDLNTSLYLVLNKEIEEKIAEKYCEAFEEMASDGTLREIHKKYEIRN
ncbi:MAG: ABC transporter substrate-binding protein [Candidatus Cloacimonetes bacterium]|nr:ABC transporter substrate-binding protein [Candidatus Cloacimonadota bacterium]